jgi:diguanylate cyclase (GGDEF)-like protein
MDSAFDHGSTAREIRPPTPVRPTADAVRAPTVGPADQAVAVEDPTNAAEAEPVAATPARPPAGVPDGAPGGARDDAQPIIRASTADRIELIARRTRMVPIGTFEIPSVLRPIAPPDGWTDLLTGTDGPRFWDRIVLSEQARVGRYHRPVTVAFAEIVGLDRLAGQWGWDVAERALAACARRLGREIRSSDHIARLEQARFGLLLTETTEIAAINFVERARASCERELGATGSTVSIGFGWASPPDKGDLSDAIDLALTRLAAELAAEPPA